MKLGLCWACRRGFGRPRVRAAVDVAGVALCAFHAFRITHPTSCGCEACDEERAIELACAPRGADPARVVVAGRIARAVRRVAEEEADRKGRVA